MSDIGAMFHQVKVSESDRDALRFLWWEDDDPDNKISVLQMTSHLFGGVWSPSCANYALRRVVYDHGVNYDSEVCSTVLNNFYVDDCLKSVENESDAIEMIYQLRELVLKGGFNLTKWISNSRKVLSSIPESDLSKSAKSLCLDKENLPRERALGLLWDVEQDKFVFEMKIEPKPMSRRGLLSTLSSVYDPLGYAAPFVFKAKILFQELCRRKYDWDQDLPPDIAMQWCRWLNDIVRLKDFSIPRCIKLAEFSMSTAQLHHFADASEQGFGAVTHLRLTNPEGKVHCSLLMSKSKLAPLKPITIPRLELAAAVESVKLDNLIKRETELCLLESVFWTDSMIVLWYLQKEEKQFQTYVANRIGTIREQTHVHKWRHVPSASNPGDDASRGLAASELIQNIRWINGPDFLWRDVKDWPSQPNFDCENLETQAEVKTTSKVYYIGAVPCDTVELLFNKYSSWYKLKKAIAWLLRLKQILHEKKVVKDELSVAEIKAAEIAIVKYVQSKHLSQIKDKSKPLKNLNPIQLPNALWCVGGRLSKANLPDHVKHQWLMPADHHITRLIILNYHELKAHAGVTTTLAETRLKFWIIKGRTVVKNLLHKCITCKKLRSQPQTPIMGDLPKSRVTPGEPPFMRVGIDYFSPFYVKRGRSELKRYGCLFTCLATRDVHIEISYSLDTNSFINALQRFIARRGQPAEIRSDNGSNLVGGRRELQRAMETWNQSQIHEFLLQKEVQWYFNPPGASHMGGVWERQIRSVRAVLRGVLAQQMLDDEGLVTLMTLVESIIKSRPITKLSSDPQDATPLTLNHLLLLRSGPATPPGLFVKQDLYRKRWQQVQYMADIFWKRWLREYLPSLQVRQKWLTPKRNLRVGDIVLMCSDTPRYQWPLGIIVDTYPGRDGYVRSVKVKTNSGVFDRPVTKICLLEGVC